MNRLLVGWGSSSMAGIGPALQGVLRSDGIRVLNEGKGGETSHHTAARIGALPLRVQVAGGLIPAAGAVRLEPTALDLVPQFLKPFSGRVAGVGAVVQGTADGIWLIRERPGDPVVVDGEPFRPDLELMLRGEDSLLWIGKNDLNRGARAPEVIARTEATARRLREDGARVAVIGHFVNNDADAASTAAVLETNTALAERFGEHFIDVQGLLTDPRLTELTGISLTSEDREALAAGRKPSSLSTDPGHLNTIGNHVVATRIRQSLEALGRLGSPSQETHHDHG